jgi:aspartyl aminopeptidase
MLSMHSVRETAGKSDHEAMIEALTQHMNGSIDIES